MISVDAVFEENFIDSKPIALLNIEEVLVTDLKSNASGNSTEVSQLVYSNIPLVFVSFSLENDFKSILVMPDEKNILDMSSTFFVSNLLVGTLFRALHQRNMLAILVTFEVLNFVGSIFKVLRLLALKNINFMLVTILVSREERSISVMALHSSKI